ncbi:2-oxo-4-hydroxy-4-carboxy-5-ureidoimidazoline decarboxylase [Dongia rigui]|uniref:2-oxo-4-hydroxy-4-carboxy-5-ureidoimidazoline decarboxylase n=1 Tax=Dongia rigui TaxID=940149 RepID=A0ABU5DUQ5_9PROT|nr:2-oxo-4-hydroxy-4-carboxy-5-ureidoimidazoline decarboxylase [Dongia rigui]MDY0871064.1 2-oxo-4-hydroxy-4-carboxy-5-ureidoimidazoline decarboxylase [Dongia rigui]
MAALEPVPTSLTRDAFVATFGRVYEHSPWIAEALYDRGLAAAHETLDGLAAAMREVVEDGGATRQLALLRAHPDLAGKLAMAGELTSESRGEQASAGLDRCSAAEFARFQQLNTLYTRRFGFPFILAVKGKTRAEILAAFETRVAHDPAVEFRTALDQVHRIAYLRLGDLCR